MRSSSAATASNTQDAVTTTNLNTPIAIRGPLTHAPNGRPPLNTNAWIAWDAEDLVYNVRSDSLWPDNPEGNPITLTRYGTNLPAVENVKEGVIYGPNGNYAGTLRVADAPSLADIAAVTGAQIAAATNND